MRLLFALKSALFTSMGICCLLTPPSHASGLPETWQSVSPAKLHARFRDAHYASSLWVAVGDHGALATSEDGYQWTEQISSTDVSLTKIAYGSGKWMALGDHIQLTSSDAKAWAVEDIPYKFQSVDFGNGTWVAVQAHEIRYSLDGKAWQLAAIPPFGDEELILQKVLYGNGRFIVAGIYGEEWKGYQTFLMDSVDGKAWTVVHQDETRLRRSTIDGDFGNNQWIFVGGNGDGRFAPPLYGQWTSTDGMHWEQTHDTWKHKVRYGPDGWVAIRHFNRSLGGPGNALLTSQDGQQWEHVSDIHCQIDEIMHSPSHWLVLRSIRREDDSFETDFKITTSLGQIPTECSNEIKGLHYLHDRFIALNQDKIRISQDGFTWREATMDAPFPIDPVLATYWENQWVIIGHTYPRLPGVIHVMSSTDGTHWTYRRALQTEGTQTPTGIVHQEGQLQLFVSDYGYHWDASGKATLDGTTSVFTTENGMDWEHTSLGGIGNQVAYADGTYIIYNTFSREIWVSQDLKDWQQVFLFTRTTIKHDGNRWLGFDIRSTWESTDGRNWNIIGDAAPSFRKLTYQNNQWIGTAGTHSVVISEDGLEWQRHTYPDAVNIDDIAIAHGVAVAAGPASAPHLIAGKLPPDLLPLSVVRDQDHLQLSWEQNQGSLVIETSDTPKGPWQFWKAFSSESHSYRHPINQATESFFMRARRND